MSVWTPQKSLFACDKVEGHSYISATQNLNILFRDLADHMTANTPANVNNRTHKCVVCSYRVWGRVFMGWKEQRHITLQNGEVTDAHLAFEEIVRICIKPKQLTEKASKKRYYRLSLCLYYI